MMLSSILHDIEYKELYEGLIMSYPKDTVVSFLKKYSKRPYISKVGYGEHGIMFMLPDVNISVNEYEKMLEKLENLYGWKPIQFTATDDVTQGGYKFNSFADVKNDFEITPNELKYLSVQIEQTHPIQLDKKDYPDILYHVSPTKFKKNILSKGLIPKSINKRFKHNDRVYFMDGKDGMSNLKVLIKLLSNENKVKEWSVYKIKTSGLPINFHLFKDDLTYNSYFSKENVPKQYITWVEDIII